MAAIAHGYVEQTTLQQKTGDANYSDISGMSVADTEFVDGAKYLIVACGLNGGSNANGNFGFRVLHGSTAFAESERVIEPNAASVYYGYLWFTVWSAVAGEGIKLQHNTINSAEICNTEDVSLFYMRLDADLVENTDWKFVETTTDTDLTTSAASFASASITPGSASDWLVLAYMQGATTTLTVSHQARLVRSGEASSSEPEVIIEPEDATNDLLQFPLVRVFALGASQANTFTVQGLLSGAGAAGDSHLHSAVFLLNLNKFKEHGSQYISGTLDLSATDFGTADISTLSLTPSVAGDVWALHEWITAPAASTAVTFKSRLQVDDVDQPGTQTSGARIQAAAWDNRDQIPVVMQTVENLSAAAHTIAVDGSTSAVAIGRGAKQRTLFAVTMELAGPSNQTMTASAVAAAGTLNAATLLPGGVLIPATAVAAPGTSVDAALLATATLTATVVSGTAAVVDGALLPGNAPLIATVVAGTAALLAASLLPGAVMLPATAVAGDAQVATANLTSASTLAVAAVAGSAAVVDATITTGAGQMTAPPVAGTALVVDAALLARAFLLATTVPAAGSVTGAALLAGIAPLTAASVAGVANVAAAALVSESGLLSATAVPTASAVSAAAILGGAVNLPATAMAGSTGMGVGTLNAGAMALVAGAVAGSAAVVGAVFFAASPQTMTAAPVAGSVGVRVGITRPWEPVRVRLAVGRRLRLEEE